MYLKPTEKIFLLLLILAYALAFLVSDDFGISWDEGWHKTNGNKAAVFIIKKFGYDINVPAYLNEYPENRTGEHGVVFDLISALMQNVFKIKEKRELFILRHRLNITFYFIGVIGIYLFSRLVFNSIPIAIIATLFYLLHPRLLGQGFFNPKDSILQSYIAMNLYIMAKAFISGNNKWYALFGLVTGLCIATRIMMIYLPILYIFVTLFYYYFGQKNKSAVPLISHYSFYLIFTFIGIYIFWPALWDNPINNFIEYFNVMKKFPVFGENFYLGQLIPVNSLPWHYTLVWIGITTPILFLVFFLVGFMIHLKSLANFKTSIKNQINTIAFGSIVIPITSIIILDSVLYDGWRHTFFLYPFMVIFMIDGLIISVKTFQTILLKIPSTLLNVTFVIIIFIIPLIDIVRLHPHQHVYFNCLTGDDPSMLFETDYWGLSYRKGLEFILSQTRSDTINLAVGSFPGKNNLQMLLPNNRMRINVTDIKYAEYYITNFRGSEFLDKYKKMRLRVPPFENEIFSTKIKDMNLLGVYRLY